MPTLDGQDDALHELILAKQWKQALNLCEKKLKKATNSDYLLVCDPPPLRTNDLEHLYSIKHRSVRSEYCSHGQNPHVISKG